MFAFVSTLFSNTTNVIEIFLHSCDNLTLKILYDVLGLGQSLGGDFAGEALVG